MENGNAFRSAFNGIEFAQPEGFVNGELGKEFATNIMKTEGSHLFRNNGTATFGVPEGGFAPTAKQQEEAVEQAAPKRGRPPVKVAETVE